MLFPPAIIPIRNNTHTRATPPIFDRDHVHGLVLHHLRMHRDTGTPVVALAIRTLRHHQSHENPMLRRAIIINTFMFNENANAARITA
jgi:hypothetical protein